MYKTLSNYMSIETIILIIGIRYWIQNCFVCSIYQDKRKWKMQDGYKIEKATSVDEDTIVLDILEKMTDGLGSKFSIKAKNFSQK